MPDPVFNSNDRVDNAPTGLPKELEGKTPQEIAAYYQKRENDIRLAARQAIANATAGGNQPGPRGSNEPVRPVSDVPKPTLTNEQFWKDPVAAVQAMQAGTLTQAQFDQLTEPFVESMIDFARAQAKSGKPHWDKYAGEIDAIMTNMTNAQKSSVKCWLVAYNNVVGTHADEIAQDAVNRSKNPPATIPPSGAPVEPPPPTDLTQVTAGSKHGVKTAAQVAEGLGLTHDQYRKGMERVGADIWPVTLDNRPGRKA